MRLKQQGIVLSALLFILVVGSLAYVVYSIDVNALQRERDQKTTEALLDAKLALIGWSVGHSQYPGTLPFPDRNGDGNYDRNSDCVVATSLNFSHLLGKLPLLAQTTPCVGSAQHGVNAEITDGYGERLWYAVSKNLIRTSTMNGVAVINPDIAHAPPEPWLVVRDKHGHIISDRVAAVIIAPGLPVGNQNRSGGLAGAGAYLDSITMSGVKYSNADYMQANEDFIVGDDMQYVSSDHPSYEQPYQFNDKLIYITIDELMATLEKRVLREAASALRAYYIASASSPALRYYPYASKLGDVSASCESGVLMGALPIIGQAVSCADPNASVSAVLPSWFVESHWQDYLYYVVSSSCVNSLPGCATGEIVAGSQTNIKVLLMSSGTLLSTQSRPSNHLSDYFDSVENANGNLIFDAIGTAQTNAYNDQLLIVSP
jgi:hypothetical protein